LTDYPAGLAPAGPGRIDAHVLLWQPSVRDQRWPAGLPPLRSDCRLDELRHWLAAAGVQTAVLVQTVQVAAETPETPEMLAGCPNVAVKLSGLLTEAGPGADARALRPYSDHLPGAFGPARTMFASDWPVSILRSGDSRVVGLTAKRLGELSSDGQAKVFGATAAAWYGFGATDHDRAGRPCE